MTFPHPREFSSGYQVPPWEPPWMPGCAWLLIQQIDMAGETPVPQHLFILSPQSDNLIRPPVPPEPGRLKAFQKFPLYPKTPATSYIKNRYISKPYILNYRDFKSPGVTARAIVKKSPELAPAPRFIFSWRRPTSPGWRGGKNEPG